MQGRLSWRPLSGALLVLFQVSCGGDEEGPRSDASGGDENAAGTGGRSGNAAGTGGAASSGDGDGAGGRSGGDGNGAGRGGQGAASRGDCKRGVAYGYHSVADLQALSPAVSWWYNWYYEPDGDIAGIYQDEDVEYVPMVWGGDADWSGIGEAIRPTDTTLLGFNEPNFGEQADLTAQEAAALWPQVEAIADAHNLLLVSPAVNYCGGDCNGENPFDYLDAFFAACNDCRVDAVAFHTYVGCAAPGEHPAQWLINQVEEYKSRFSQPLWLTEFACDSAASFAEQQAFMEDAVDYLENEPRVERYAWFAGRADNVPFVDLLGESGELTTLGEAYLGAPQPDHCTR